MVETYQIFLIDAVQDENGDYETAYSHLMGTILIDAFWIDDDELYEELLSMGITCLPDTFRIEGEGDGILFCNCGETGRPLVELHVISDMKK